MSSTTQPVHAKDCIYKLTSPSGKVYIGQAKCFKRRMREYANGRSKNQRKLYAAILKYGWSEFKKEVISVCPEFESDRKSWLDAAETHAIREHGAAGRNGYNILSIGGSSRGMKQTAHQKEVARAVLRKLHTCPAFKEANRKRAAAVLCALRTSPVFLENQADSARKLMAARNADPVFRNESKLRMAAQITSPSFQSKRMEGRAQWLADKERQEQFAAKMSCISKGRGISSECRMAAVEANTGRVPTKESREKMSNSHIGKSHSIETKAKTSAAAKARKRDASGRF